MVGYFITALIQIFW